MDLFKLRTVNICTAEYESGKCNINSEEVERRYYSSLVMFLVVAGFIGLIFYYPRSAVSAYMYVSPVFHHHICFADVYAVPKQFLHRPGLARKEKTGDGSEEVESSEDVRKDRKKRL